MGRSATFWLHVAVSGLLVFIVTMNAGLPLARHFGYHSWPQLAQDGFIALFTVAIVMGSAGAVVGGSFCLSLSRHR